MLFWLIFIAALLARLPYLETSWLAINHDAGMVGLAALHWYQGSDFPLMSYGQAYLGTLEAIVSALLFKIFGYGMLGLSLSPLLFSLGFVTIVYFFGIDLGGKRFGLIAMAFAAIPSHYLSQWSSAVKGGYASTLFFGTLLLWLAWKKKNYFLIGLVAGLAWWCHPLSIFYLIPVALYLLRFISIKKLFNSFFGFLVGSLPFWIYNLQNHFLSFAGGGGQRWHQIAKGFSHFWLLAIPSMFHLKPLAPSIFAQILMITVITLFALSLLFLWRRPLFLLFFLSVTLLYSTHKFGVMGETRYVMFLYSLAPFALAWLCERFRRAGKLAGAIPLVLFLPHNSFAIFKDASFWKVDSAPKRRQVELTLETLKENGITRLVSQLGPERSVMTREKVIGAEPYEARFPLHELVVDAADTVALEKRVLYPSLDSTLSAAGIEFEVLSTSQSILHYNFRGPHEALEEIPPAGWKGTSDPVPERASAAYDRNLAAAWSTLQHKKPGQSYSLDLGRSVPLRLIRIYNGRSFYDFPASLILETSPDGKRWEKAVEIEPYQFVYWDGARPFWQGYHPRLEIRLSEKPVRALRFTQTGSSGKYYWTINEIYLYRRSGPAQPATEKDFQYLIEYLKANQIQFVYAGRRVSAKVILATKGKIKACRPYNAKYPHAPGTGRRIKFSRRWALVFENEDPASTQKTLDQFKIPYQVRELGPYTVLTGFEMPEGNPLPDLYWTGFSIATSSAAR